MDVLKINVKRKIQVSIFKLPEEELLCLPLSVGLSVRWLVSQSVEKISKLRGGDYVGGEKGVI